MASMELAGGDSLREEFGVLVTEHSRSMFRAARALLDCDADAEDAVGEAILRAWRKREQLRDPAAGRAWLLKITVNCAYEQRRRAARLLYTDQVEGIAGDAEDQPVSHLWEAVLRLPGDQRAVVTLYYYEDLPVKEIARILGVAQGTVKSRLGRARARLKQMLREEEDP